jgi:hypothetical protein
MPLLREAHMKKMICVLTLAATGSVTLTDTISVGPDLGIFDYTMITGAIVNAESGEKVLIAPGLYAENQSVSGKDLAMRNAGGGTVTVFGQDLDKCFVSLGSTTDVVVVGDRFRCGGIPPEQSYIGLRNRYPQRVV